MAEVTGISWTDHTFNPWWGCVQISPACDFCYAKTLSHRWGNDVWGKDAPRKFMSDLHWREPVKWNRNAKRAGVRRRVFSGSMCDILEERPDLIAPRARLWRLIADTPWLDWLLLTKRPQNYRKMLPFTWMHEPLPNVWLGTTVEGPDYYWRIDDLKSVPAVVHFLSMEPLLQMPVGIRKKLDHIEWVIAGGESGSGARPSDPAWFREVRDATKVNGSAFHFKQFGEHNADLIRVGTKKAGCVLDGREWKEFPSLRYTGHLTTQ